MGEVVGIFVGLALGVLAVQVANRHLPRDLHPYIVAGLVAHLGAATFKVVLVYGLYDGRGDMDSYLKWGARYAEVMLAEPSIWVPEFAKMLVHLPAEPPMRSPGSAPATRAMMALSTFIQAALGPSKLGMNLIISSLSFAGKLPIIFAFREAFHRRYHKRIAFAVVLLPSVVFWSGALAKEGVACIGFGWVVWGVWSVLSKRRRVAGLVAIGLGAIPIAMVKAYILFTLGLGAGVWFWARRPNAAPRNVALNAMQIGMRSLFALVVAAALTIGLGQAFPRYAVNNLVDEVAEMQETGAAMDRSAQISMGTGATSIQGQAVVAPFAIVTALYRPLIFEIRNPLMFLNALETTALLVLTFMTLRQRGLVGTVRAIRGSPELLFCATFTLLFATAVGITSTNLGTLSRYRMPMMPFFATLLLVLAPIHTRVVAHRRPPTRSAA